ncbi:DNA-processing protein DprA [Thermus albus]|uniref:DNA-processing protein DprA n=1 Tax=Thermus albus TaxID=2908146 RepID=UPI001FAAF7C6|nr:DNA-processing protein DprA [Thermus albus]
MAISLKKVLPGSPGYPSRLEDSLKGPLAKPPSLYFLGREDLANPTKALAILGSRHALEEALHLAREAAEYFAKASYTVITGLARGVDWEATLGALERGYAIGVVPFGLKSPDATRLLRKLGQYLSERLLLLSELEPYLPWRAHHAMRRNRLVVGLADAVLIIQTGPKAQEVDGRPRQSGTWDAAEKAHAMGRPVFVLDLPIEGNQALKRSLPAIPVPPGKEGFEFIEAMLGPALPNADEKKIVYQPRLL